MIGRKKAEKLATGLAIHGEKMLNDTEEDFLKIEKYLMNLPEQLQEAFAYVFVTKLLSGFEKESRNQIIKRLRNVDWSKIEEGEYENNNKDDNNIIETKVNEEEQNLSRP